MGKEKITYADSKYDELIELFEKVEKIFEKDFGKMCPEFEPLCSQCNFWNKFNTFKNKTFEDFL